MKCWSRLPAPAGGAMPAEPTLLRFVPLFVAAAIGLLVVAMAWLRPIPTTEMKLDEFGRLPVVRWLRQTARHPGPGTLKSLGP